MMSFSEGLFKRFALLIPVILFIFTSLTINGKLLANGTSGQPIVFTSNSATPAPGNWRSISFSGATGSVMSYATISYAGATDGGAIVVNANSPTFDHLTISNSSTTGIINKASSSTWSNPSLSSSTISNNGTYGVNLSISGTAVNITDTVISNNGDYAIGAQANTHIYGLTGITATGNGGGTKNAIGYRGGTINTANEIWIPGLDWVVTSMVYIGDSQNPSDLCAHLAQFPRRLSIAAS